MGNFDGMWETRLRIAGYPETPMGIELMIKALYKWKSLAEQAQASAKEAHAKLSEMEHIRRVFERHNIELTAASVEQLLRQQGGLLRQQTDELREAKETISKLKSRSEKLVAHIENMIESRELRDARSRELVHEIADGLGIDLG